MIICFKDPNSNSPIGNFVEEESVDTFNNKYPKQNILYTFDFNSKTSWSDARNFETYCQRYGFLPKHYRAKFTTETGDIEELVGFRVTNHKYPCIVWNSTKNKHMKATPQYIHKRLQISYGTLAN